MFCQLISNMTWKSSSIKVLQKKKFVGSFEWNSCQQGFGLERSLQCTMCKSANVLMCKCINVQIESRWIRTQKNFANLQKCKCVNVQIKSRWIQAQKNFANCATQHRSRGLNSLLANFLGSTSKRKSRFEVGSLVGWRVSELHEGVSCRPDVLKCFGLFVKQRCSQCYAPTTAQTIILAMLH